MSILYVVTNIFQLAVFLTLTGVLFSVAAVSQMMEMTIVHFINPMTTFMLRQSCKIAMLLASLSVRFMWCAYSKMCESDQQTQSPLEINLETPEISYERSAIPGLVEETQPLVYDINIAIGKASTEPEMVSTALADDITVEPTAEEEEEEEQEEQEEQEEEEKEETVADSA